MIYVFIANGFEEIEALTVVDILRRAKLEVQTVGISSKTIIGAHGIKVFCDILSTELILNKEINMIVLPGGMPGTLNLEKSQNVQEAIEFCVINEIYIAAICAAPTILGNKGLLRGKKAVCFPGFEEQLLGAIITDNFIEQDGKIITAKGVGVAIDFSLMLVEVIIGSKKSEAIKYTLQCKC